jgi:DNA (cytosine-5)-methyltransferase 1
MPRLRKAVIAGKRKLSETKVVDLFCGVGGLSHGLKLEGFKVVAGVDNDKGCKFAFEENNDASFIGKDISRFTVKELKQLFKGARTRVLVGCAPCQPFSALNKKRLQKKDALKHWYPLFRFMRLIRAVKPEIVSMENVPDLSNEKRYPVFAEFLQTLDECGYSVSYKIVDSSKYGVPQRRKRLVLLASRLGAISLIPETHDEDDLVTVRDAISALPRIKDGIHNRRDPLHRSSELSPLNKKRIAATPRNGGSAKSWDKSLLLECYKKDTGRSYMCSVYGRMRWDEPSPTITTQCTSLGTGRFGHPSQNRAISLREAALLQSFPAEYRFIEGNTITMKHLSRQIGNAVPVLLGRAIGASLKKHIRQHA